MMEKLPKIPCAVSLVALLAPLCLASGANAALVDCPSDFTADGTSKVFGDDEGTAVSDCEYLDDPDPSNVANEENVNDAGFFGSSDWAIQEENDEVDTEDQDTGSWSIADPGFDQFDYMITFKSGQGTNLVSFLFNGEYSSGDWTTPFTDPPFDLAGNTDQREVSHYSIFERATSVSVPEPGTLGLLGIGLAMAGLSGRRRQR